MLVIPLAINNQMHVDVNFRVFARSTFYSSRSCPWGDVPFTEDDKLRNPQVHISFLQVPVFPYHFAITAESRVGYSQSQTSRILSRKKKRPFVNRKSSEVNSLLFFARSLKSNFTLWFSSLTRGRQKSFDAAHKEISNYMPNLHQQYLGISGSRSGQLLSLHISASVLFLRARRINIEMK